MNYETKSQIRRGWVELLKRQDTKCFLTITFRSDITIENANNIIRKLLRMLRKEYYGRNRQRKYIVGFVVVEHQRNGRPHYHILLADNEVYNNTDKKLELVIRKKCCSFTAIDPINGIDFREYYDGSLEGYLTKSIEWGQDDFDFIKPTTYDGF
jgi:hypothetical protein